MGRHDTFYFLKVELGIDTCEEVAAVERLKHGPEYLWLWIRLALKYANYGGVLCRRIGENVYPVTPDDLEAEMKGGFNDVSIKDGIATLIQGSLIYINSDGFMAITGLTISGDPKEPVLHKQNSNDDGIRPLSIGNDTKIAKYHRERRARLKEEAQHPHIAAPEGKMLSYAEIAKKAMCTKQTVINRLKSLNAEDYIQTFGQKKMVPFHIAQYLIYTISGKTVPVVILDALRLDGFDGLRLPSKTIQIPSNTPSNTINEPSKENDENTDKQSELDGFANANNTANLDANNLLLKSKEYIEIDDDINKGPIKNHQMLEDLFHVGFDKQWTNIEQTQLDIFLKLNDYNTVLCALKEARKRHADNLGYVQTLISQMNNYDYEIKEEVIPGRDISNTIQLFDEDIRGIGIENEEELKELIRYYSTFYSDTEIINALRSMSCYRLYNKEAFVYFLRCDEIPTEDAIKRLIEKERSNDTSYFNS